MKKRPEFTNQRKKDALARNEAWAKLTPEQQLAELDARLGKGVGAKKQRARLEKLIKGSDS